MILVGQYDSPFVRRAGTAMVLYGMAFEHRAWSTFRDAGKLATLNPLVRVPVLVMDDGRALYDSWAILDWLDGQVAPEVALHPREEPARHRVMWVTALGVGLAEKAVALFYEGVFHQPVSDDWAARGEETWFGRLTPADIAVACALGFITSVLPGSFDAAAFPALARHVETMNSLPAFSEIYAPFSRPT